MFQRPRARDDLEAYIDGVGEVTGDNVDRQDFNTRLQAYYRRKWSCSVVVPTVNGRTVDLYRLYSKVASLGGWRKVCNTNKWSAVYEHCDILESMCGADFVLKDIYIRFLSRYEHFAMTGDDSIMDGDDAGYGRSRSKHHTPNAFASVAQCPVGRPRLSVSSHARRLSNMQTLVKHKGTAGGSAAFISNALFDTTPSSSTERNNALTTRDDPRFDALYKSLMSGLPNEVDFAMNTCTLLSHPGPRFVDVSLCPRLLTLMLAHAGVVDDKGDMVEVFNRWTADWPRKRSFAQFWQQNVGERGVAKFFHNRYEFRLKEVVSWRVYQVACIVRNLSFEQMNRATLAASRPLRSLCYMCVQSHSSQLQAIGWDILSNVCTELAVGGMSAEERTLLGDLVTGKLGADNQCKTHLVRACETLSALCNNEGPNTEYIAKLMTPTLLQHLHRLLTVTDIMVVVYVLELIYQLSELGGDLCDVVAREDHMIDLLVDLTTIEAVSFGKRGLDGMKVVEYASSHNKQPRTVQSYPPAAAHRVEEEEEEVPGPAPSQPSIVQPTSSSSVPSISPAQQLTTKWIEKHIKCDKSASVNRGVLYAAYCEEMLKTHNTLALSQQSFVQALREKHPSIIVRSSNASAVHIDGIAHASSLAQTHPVMQQILTNGGGGGENSNSSNDSAADVVLNGKHNGGGGDVVEVKPLKAIVDKVKLVEKPVVARPINGQRVVKTVRIINNNIKVIKTHNGNGAIAEEGDEPRVKRVKLMNDRGVMPPPPPASGTSSLYTCDWKQCKETYGNVHTLQGHVMKEHLPTAGTGEQSVCEWGDTCDMTRRSRWSLCTHLQEQHVSEAQLTAAMNRRGSNNFGRPKAARPAAPPHAGYSGTAAIDAIRRHAMLHNTQKDITEEMEGPVTRSLRLTSSLVLRNMSRHSSLARRLIARHEGRLAYIALSQMESSQALAQCISHLSKSDDDHHNDNN